MTTAANIDRGEPAPSPPNPMQPVVLDRFDRPAFKANAIIDHMLDAGPLDMNKLALMEASREDREQFAQLIGYSVGGFCELSYVSDEACERAYAMADALAAGDTAPAGHPRQPLVVGADGLIRFKRNAVVAALLKAFEASRKPLDKDAFADAEWEQLLQLRGATAAEFAASPHASKEAIDDMKSAISNLCVAAGIASYDGGRIAP